MNLEQIKNTPREDLERYLTDFEDEIKGLYLAGKIRSPVHFCKGNEKELIDIFRNVNEGDWFFSTHRSHYHALLAGIDKEWLKQEILENKSIHLNNEKYNFFTSAIVAGALPIAVGVAEGIKHKNSGEHVWAFIGDMGARTGIYYECREYAEGHDLPITFVREDNGFSVNTPTKKVWGEKNAKGKEIAYAYERVYPHHGCGQWVTF
ncbi:MAG TPA: thiamine pyrophosphate-dependent enzyme [Candidatus Nanoarchaeia archaeon]|nr:thiamine pyrophosphate-dependent enzyme [Candidatus Nanoarchaeia archaeon]